MKYFVAIIIGLSIALAMSPTPMSEGEPGSIVDAYDTWLANPLAYADQPCIRSTTYLPRFRPQGHTPNFKPADWQRCTRTP